MGGNGTGKTTLLKILGGMEPLEGGLFSAPKDITAGYLPQDGLSLSGRTVMEECLSVFGDLLELEEEMESPDSPDGGKLIRAAMSTTGSRIVITGSRPNFRAGTATHWRRRPARC